jgi:recombination protein RecA
MSSAVVSTSAAPGRPFFFEDEEKAGVCPQPSGADLFGEGRPPQRVVPATFPKSFHDRRLAGVTPASQLGARPAPEMASCGISALDTLTGGLARGCLTEIYGPPSSGRTTLLLAALSAATRRGEYCAIVDAGDALHPQSAADAGVELERLLWVRCGKNSPAWKPAAALRPGVEKENLKREQASKLEGNRSSYSERSLEQLLRVADLLLESGGFGLIALDLGDLPPQMARRIPLTTWFRFRRAVEHTPTVLLAIERQPVAGSCSSLLIKLGSGKQANGQLRSSALPTHAHLLTELGITAEIVRSRMERKPAGSVEAAFASKTAWAG